jgi:hypothetical protein
MTTILYTVPYTNDVRMQTFRTREEAYRMIDFYRSCGQRAYLKL